MSYPEQARSFLFYRNGKYFEIEGGKLPLWSEYRTKSKPLGCKIKQKLEGISRQLEKAGRLYSTNERKTIIILLSTLSIEQMKLVKTII